jgi:hypothetical protein
LGSGRLMRNLFVVIPLPEAKDPGSGPGMRIVLLIFLIAQCPNR